MRAIRVYPKPTAEREGKPTQWAAIARKASQLTERTSVIGIDSGVGRRWSASLNCRCDRFTGAGWSRASSSSLSVPCRAVVIFFGLLGKTKTSSEERVLMAQVLQEAAVTVGAGMDPIHGGACVSSQSSR